MSMTKIPSDEILEILYRLRLRESEKLKTVLKLYDWRFSRRNRSPSHTIAGDEQLRRDQQFQDYYPNKIGIFVKLMSKVFMRWTN